MDRDNKQYKSFPVLAFLIGCVLLSGCSVESQQPGVSGDLASLREIVDIQIPIKAARWEVFGTPEYTGGVPGPTDFISLVAELTPSKPGWIDANHQPTGPVYIAPEAARSWLSDTFRSLLAKNKNTTVDISAQFNCRKYGAIVKKTGKQANGVVCGDAEHLLLYLTLSASQ